MSFNPDLGHAKRLFKTMRAVVQSAAAVVLYLDKQGMGQLPIVKNLRENLLAFSNAEQVFNDEVVRTAQNN